MEKNFTLPGRQNGSVQGKPLPRTAGEGDSPFTIPGRDEGSVKGTPVYRTAGVGDVPWYVPGLGRNHGGSQIVEFALTYEDDYVTYYNMRLTYTMILS